MYQQILKFLQIQGKCAISHQAVILNNRQVISELKEEKKNKQPPNEVYSTTFKQSLIFPFLSARAKAGTK